MSTSTAAAPTRPDWLDTATWPFVVHALDIDQTTIAYTDEGAGPVLVLVHSGMWSFIWRDVIVRLRRDFRVIAFDPPAMGLSATGRGAGIEPTAAALDGLVTALDLRAVTLVAHDLGGPAALQAAARWPDRLQGFVAINCFGWRPAGVPFRLMLRLMGTSAMREADAWTGWLPRAASTRFGVGRHLSKADRRAFRAGMDRRGRRSLHRNLRSPLRHDFGEVDHGRAAIAALPLLTIFGQRNDPLRFQPQWKAVARDIEQVVVPHGNHFPMCDDPDLVADSITAWYARKIAYHR